MLQVPDWMAKILMEILSWVIKNSYCLVLIVTMWHINFVGLNFCMQGKWQFIIFVIRPTQGSSLLEYCSMLQYVLLAPKIAKKILLGISVDLNCKTLFSQLLQSEMFVENCHRKLKWKKRLKIIIFNYSFNFLITVIILGVILNCDTIPDWHIH